MPRLVTPWTPSRLSARIREGEVLLVELETQPPWMGELLRSDLERKRRLLKEIQSTTEAA